MTNASHDSDDRPPREMEYEDDSSHKFWRIELNGSSHTVTFGKVGTSGQTQTKEFDDDEEAAKSYDKLVAEKLKKGYEETGDAPAAPAAKAPAAKAAPAKAAAVKSTASAPASKPAAKAVAKPAKAAAPAPTGDRPPREMEYEDDSSHKFWRIELSGASHTVTFGRVGTDGQTQTKEFDSDDEAAKSYDKLVAEKLKKGYVEQE